MVAMRERERDRERDESNHKDELMETQRYSCQDGGGTSDEAHAQVFSIDMDGIHRSVLC